ncbi:hypothetical protein [Massilia sp. NR 4-1]|uniref:hypothetical protein n=1 Tax=Massilia sp. NR 4-1 TaxID=1678028 RepID=UPI0012371D7F|nr:hypothetical protein [Massilia sp. NR 4-1]
MDTNQLKKMKRHRRTYRFMGFTWALVGAKLLFSFVPLLFDPASTISSNGVLTSDMGTKVSAVVFCGAFVVAGLCFLFVPDRLLDRLFIWRQSMLSQFTFWRK